MSGSETLTCASCGNEFSLDAKVASRYPGWRPTECRKCYRPSASASKGSGSRPRSRAREENLTLDEVIAKYHEGPDTGVFTDGSATPNPGPGGWGAVYVVGGEVVEMAHGAEPHTTNNRMELQAVIGGIDLVPDGTTATIY